MRLTTLLKGMAAAAALMSAATTALADVFPSKPIQIIVPFGQGGAGQGELGECVTAQNQ